MVDKMDIKQLYESLGEYEKVCFLQWVAQKEPNKYEYAALPTEIRVYYNGPLREDDLKRKENG